MLNKKDELFLQEMSRQLNTQDNRSTFCPIWKILKIKKYMGFKERYSDGVCILNTNTGRIYETKLELEECIMENALDINGEIYKSFDDFLRDVGYTASEISERELIEIIDVELGIDYLKKEYYKEIHELEGCFLTEESILKYMETNKHRLDKNIHVYVDSAYDNPDMVKLLSILKKYNREV